MSIRNVISLENAFACVICFLFYMHLDYSVILFFLLLFVPDVTMIGYLFNPKIGATLYNIGHSFVVPYVVLAVAFFNDIPFLLMISLIWLAHIYLDRSIGFGLKYKHSFHETHLQKIV